jgi:hypothetical protein
MKDAPHDGTQILAFWYNGCSWECAVVWWGGDVTYPWRCGINNDYPDDKFDCWQHIRWPRRFA